MEEALRLLAVHAHPDDESFGTGGTLARCAAEGVETILVCATGGEEGDMQNPDLDPDEVPADMGRLRMKELEAACAVLGIHRIILLGYRDSGMEGRPSNSHPDALRNADLQEATERLVGIVRETRPHVVITYNEKGFYGHPDHIAVNRMTVAAVDAAGASSRYPHIPWAPWKPSRLYYTAAPRSRLLNMKKFLEARGERFDWDIDFLATPDEEITVWVDVSPFLDRKLRAIYSHRSQVGPKSFVSRLKGPLRTEVLGTECYVCVRGCDNLSREDDLFHGMRG